MARPVANDSLALLAARVADYSLAGFSFDQHMAAKTSDYQTRLCALDRRCAGTQLARCFAQASKASTFDAQKKSLTEMPLTSCVSKRTVHRL